LSRGCLQQPEIDFDLRRDRYRPAVFTTGLESPLTDRFDRFLI
jgi:hypothetical protein